MSTGRDLRHLQNPSAIEDAFSKLVSGGKIGYKTVIEKKKIPSRCTNCGRGGEYDQKFCSQCGGEMKVPLVTCPKCEKQIGDTEKFCTECGTKFS
ncbi:MAG: zinc ribbon domain-containing protein [Nanoarchaeota archaeon]|nr:zinc ribbon domain-containing protein [Nanoarchaeota archaeon]MBU4085996.1 zinc ribbon domain-containing protein [Nanoarchaeota archaeon]